MIQPAPFQSDTEIAAAAHRALATRRCIPCDRIRIEVRDGRITLEGEVEWLYQCFDAYEAVCHVREAAGCINHITVVAHPLKPTGSHGGTDLCLL